MKCLILILLSVSYLWCHSSCADKIFDKHLSFPDINGLIAAFGDFDFDRITDIFLITDKGLSLELAKGNIDDEEYLKKWPKIKCSFDPKFGEQIVGVIPSDFTGNSYMDVLIVTQNIHSSQVLADSNDKIFNIWLFISNQTYLQCNTLQPIVKDVKSFPTVLDFDGDMITDFIVETKDCQKMIVFGKTLKSECFEYLKTSQHMQYPDSNAFIDLSKPNDFAADILIRGVNQLEYWFSNQGYDSKNVNNISYPNRNIYKFIGQSTFADINFDGVIDHLIPVCKSDIKTCTDPQILVLNLGESGYEWIEILHTKQDINLTFTLIKLFDYLDLNVMLRVGDIDLDGYPDAVTVMREIGSETTRAVWLENCRTDDNKFGREFRFRWISDDSLSNGVIGKHNVDLVSLFDFNEDGELEIIINSHISDEMTFILDAYKNSEKLSSNFIKVLVTTGVSNDDSPQMHIRTPLIGPFLCYTPAEGDSVSCGGQLSQSSHFSLQLPFVLFGLGDTPNFVQSLTVSIPSGSQTVRKRTWEELIPDSSIIIIAADNPDNWIQKLYLDPKYYAFQTLITLTSICCLLVLIIAVLHRRDLRRDILEHKEYRKHWLKA
ncbi:T-cell immunomodulatory protein-like [Oppia nitens]|uniref:T-cell immunomodulatory protein-like n=1 Tax=Oppia nitens TaxID=1686743 RepID=UPI0023DA4DA1|nr:T-cell immunomodulatory protein-like [Oppia nitens]